LTGKYNRQQEQQQREVANLHTRKGVLLVKHFFDGQKYIFD